MNINGKWYSEPELAAYIAELEEKLRDRDLEADNGVRQIAHYDDELRRAKELLKAAVEDFKVIGKALDADCDMLINCDDCPLQSGHYNCRSWNHQNEALALIGGGRDVFATDINVSDKGGAENEEQ